MFTWIKARISNNPLIKLIIKHKSNYLKFIIVFGILFTILQISDLTITQHALKNPENRELNPLYGQEWFVPFKLTMVLLIMTVMYRIPDQNRKLAKGAMVGMIYMYIFININNLYFLLK
jgi:uncharacterized BrkB/YihY/UPF0761 family membrane protein